MVQKPINFLKELLSNQRNIPFGFNMILPESGKTFVSERIVTAPEKMVVVKDIPDYLEVEFNDLVNKFRTAKIKTLEGYYIELSAFDGYDDYLKLKISSKRRSNLRKYQRRLEQCFDIRYTIYCGAIDQQEYRRLFEVMEEFLKRRFTEKKEVNYEIPHLREMEELLYDLILSKKASLFVIYHNNRPISIRINMFYKELAYYIISGYDIDYSAFHIGAIDMLKNIEWCMENRFTRYDLLKGYADYKKNWTTHRYYNYDHLIYQPGSLKQLSKKALLFAKLQLRYGFLKLSRQFGFYNGLKKLKKIVYTLRFGTKSIKYHWTSPAIDLSPGHEIRVFDDPEYCALRRPVYDYLFRHKEQLEDIGVFALASHNDKFLLKGKNASRILIINKR